MLLSVEHLEFNPLCRDGGFRMPSRQVQLTACNHIDGHEVPKILTVEGSMMLCN